MELQNNAVPMKISIVTPTYNRITYLDQTIRSIVNQQGDFDLEYIIQDGGSGSDLIELLQKWELKIARKEIDIGCKSLKFTYRVEQDQGMYDAINRGFASSSGDIMAWLNSDDMYHPYALQTVAQVFGKFDQVSWITGIPNSYNRFGSRSGFDHFPAAYSRKFLQDGCYNLKYLKKYGFNWIQQESTFWRRSLWDTVGGRLDTQYKYAADFYLWLQFAKHAELVKVNSFLGGYRVHKDQFTAEPQRYAGELPNLPQPPRGLYVLRRILATLPHSRRLFFNRKQGAPFLNLLGLHFADLVGEAIDWSFQEEDWVMRTRAIV